MRRKAIMEQPLLFKQFTQNETYYTGCVIIKARTFGVAKNNNPYVQLTLMDKSGTIHAMFWERSKETFPYQPGEIVEVKARVKYRDNIPELHLDNVEAVPTTDPRHNFENYLPVPPMDYNQMVEEIKYYVANIQHPVYHQLAQTFIQKSINGNDLTNMPASKQSHHAYYRGLLYHTVRTLRHAVYLLNIYDPTLVDSDLLITGALIHDLGKIASLSGFIETEYTLTGQLIGNTNIVDGWIVDFAKANNYDVNDDTFSLLRHMILSQNNSGVRPVIIEPEMLSQVKIIDERITQFEDELRDIPSNSLSENIFPLNYRPIYNHKQPIPQVQPNERKIPA